MKKKLGMITMALILTIGALTMPGCGGGGGGGGVTLSPTTNTTSGGGTSGTTYRITGTAVDTGLITSRAATAVSAGRTIVARNAHTGQQLTVVNGITLANGTFDITVNIGSGSSLDVIVEVVTGDGSNLKVAFDDLSGAQTGVTVDYGTTRKATIFSYIPDSALAEINKVDDLYSALQIDLLSSVNTAALATDLLGYTNPIISACSYTSGKPDYACIQTQVQNRATTSTAVQAVKDLGQQLSSACEAGQMQDKAPGQPLNTLKDVTAIFDDAGSSLESIDVQSEIDELCAKMADALTVWRNSSLALDGKRIAIKYVALALKFGETYSNQDVANAISNLRSKLSTKIANGAVASTNLISATDMGSTINVYDIARGMLIQVLVEDAPVSRTTAATAVDALLQVLGRLGATSENASSLYQMTGNWVPVWDEDAVRTNLMTALAPLGMDDPSKTNNLMRLAHDIAGLSNPTDAQVRAVLATYLSTATTDEAMGLYTKYKGQTCSLNYTFPPLSISTSAGCPTEEEIIHLIETHYEKPLPKLRSVVDGVQAWVNNPDNNIYLLAVANASGIYQNIVNNMMASESNKSQLSYALYLAGVKPELFWLYINVSPYL